MTEQVAGAQSVRSEDSFDVGAVDAWLRSNADASGCVSRVRVSFDAGRHLELLLDSFTEGRVFLGVFRVFLLDPVRVRSAILQQYDEQRKQQDDLRRENGRRRVAEAQIDHECHDEAVAHECRDQEHRREHRDAPVHADAFRRKPAEKDQRRRNGREGEECVRRVDRAS